MRTARIFKQLTTATLLKTTSPNVLPIVTRSYSATFQGLPFKITRAEVNEKLANHKRFLEASNSIQSTSALVPFKEDPVKTCFIPFHSGKFDDVYSEFIGEWGKDRIVYYWTLEYDPTTKTTRMVQRSYTVTDWYRCSGTLPSTNYPFGTKQTQIYAGFDYPSAIIQKVLASSDVVFIDKITDEMLAFDGSKKIIYPHEMNMAYALEKLNANIYDLEKSRAHNYIKYIYNADHTKVHTLDVHLEEADIDLTSYHIPAYIYQTHIKDLSSCKVVHGYSGKIDGNKIYSIIKSTIFGASIGGVLGYTFTAFTRPYFLIPQLLLRGLFTASISGAVSGMVANILNQSREYDFVTIKAQEKKENQQYLETEDDIARRELIERINQQQSIEEKKHLRLPADKLKLFGFNAEDEINFEMLQAAYHKQVKRWHPDFFGNKRSVDKEIAKAMTQQLNDAYDEYSQVLKPKSR